VVTQNQENGTERLDSPERNLSQGYVSDENLSDRFDSSDRFEDGLDRFEDDDNNRIYSNQVLNLGKIKCYGFDMDYTLCEYISPAYDELGFNLTKEHLVSSLGYDNAVLDLHFNPEFTIRGLWFDKKFGNILKVDQFGKILLCLHGFRKVVGSELRSMYPHKIQRKDDHRIFVMNTLFNLAETHLLASIIDLYNKKESLVHSSEGWTEKGKEGTTFTFKKLFQDVRSTIDYIHIDTMDIKKRTIQDLPRYVKKDGRLLAMLKQIQNGGRTSFLVTNSDWWYTQHIMRFLLAEENSKDTDDWMSWFSVVVVDSCKPKFFMAGTPLSRVDIETRELSEISGAELKTLRGSNEKVVYSGGHHRTITRLLGVEEPEVLYCGDHLYGDVVKCRKECEWRTMLVVPELEHEAQISLEQEDVLQELHKLENMLARKSMPQFESLRDELRAVVNKLDGGFGQSGSLFRAGSRLTYFGSQMLIWADVYTGSALNLVGYSLNERFLPPPAILPHETRARTRGVSPQSP